MDPLVTLIVAVLIVLGIPTLRFCLEGMKYGGFRGHAEPLLRRMTRDEVVRVLQRAKGRHPAD